MQVKMTVSFLPNEFIVDSEWTGSKFRIEGLLHEKSSREEYSNSCRDFTQNANQVKKDKQTEDTKCSANALSC